ncbi:sensor histidine kinase [Streptomyces sp. NPDC101110]|uniref:sensor histidine kinase n=1 Tax=Streptomyces sp. NPDC101110 TaxID=3366104 RepID=UPI0038165F1B
MDIVLSAGAIAYALPVYFAIIPRTDPSRGASGEGRIDWLFIAWVVTDVAAGLAIVVRRRLPLLMGGAAVLARFVTGSVLTVPIAVYTLVRLRRYWWAAATGSAFCVNSLYDFYTESGPGVRYGGVPLLAVQMFEEAVIRNAVPFVLFPVLAAVSVRQHRQRIDNLQVMNRQLQREQELVSRNAALTERARIAREMHDVVTHYVGLIILRAGALEITAGPGSPAGQSGSLIAGLGRKAMRELRDLLGVLRTDISGPDTALSRTSEAPFVPDVEQLLSGALGAGIAVSWFLHDGFDEFDPRTKQAVYRIVQEALTNAARHAPGADVLVVADRLGDTWCLKVRNGATRSAMRPDSVSGGLGLVGMRQRAESIGATLTAWATPAGEFEVILSVPLDSEARTVTPENRADREPAPEPS